MSYDDVVKKWWAKRFPTADAPTWQSAITCADATDLLRYFETIILKKEKELIPAMNPPEQKAAQKCAECDKPAAHGSQFCSDACASQAAARQGAGHDALPVEPHKCWSFDTFGLCEICRAPIPAEPAPGVQPDYKHFDDCGCEKCMPPKEKNEHSDGGSGDYRSSSGSSRDGIPDSPVRRDLDVAKVAAEPAAQPSEKEAKPWSLLRDLLDVTDLDERWMPEQKKRYDAVVERAEQALKKAGTK